MMFPGISFTPREVGDYLVNVYRHGNHIPNSPFKIYVGESEVGRADRVRVYGRGLIQGRANTLNEFFVDTRDAGLLKNISISLFNSLII